MAEPIDHTFYRNEARRLRAEAIDAAWRQLARLLRRAWTRRRLEVGHAVRVSRA
ncbi:MAG: hypothetical protein U1E17_08530 [Geminicoccaceae bacterium]